MQAKNLFLLRHGYTGLAGRYLGSSDVPLSDRGRAQVRKTGELLRGCEIDTVICSPMLRCRQTLLELNLRCPVDFDDRLVEINFGRWEGKTFEEIAKEDQALIDLWAGYPEEFTFPGGESLQGFGKRVASFKEGLYQLKENNLLILCHGGVIRHLLCLFLGLEVRNYLIFDADYGSYSSLRLFQEGGVLTGFNIRG